MRLFVVTLLMALLPQMALAERAEVVAARDAVTACLYFYGMNNVGYEFPVGDARKVRPRGM